LTPLEIKNAFRIVLHQTAGSIQSYWDGDMTFKLNSGFASRSGVLAAELAGAGLTGTIDPLQGRFSYYKLFTHGCTHPERLTQDIGKKFNIGRNIFKQFPGGGPNHIPVECALALAEHNDIDARDVAEVNISLPRFFHSLYYAQPWSIRDFPPGDAMFSYRYTVSCALLRRHLNQEDMQPKAIRDPEINTLISKVKLSELQTTNRDAAEIRVKMKNGQEFVKSTEAPRHGLNGKDEINAKFMNQVEFSKTVSVYNAEKIIKLLEKLEEVGNINQITNLMVASSE
jgi:2-methylcitrate dehydratase PrpD